jgi:hypothetical protein
MRSSLLLLASLLVLSAQLAGCTSRPKILGEPLFVNGKRVSDRELERYLICGPCHLKLEMRRVGLIIEQEIGHRAVLQADAAFESDVAAAAQAATERSLAVQKAHEPFPSDAMRKIAFDAELARQNALAKTELHRQARWTAKYESALKQIRADLAPSDVDFEAEAKRTIADFVEKYPSLDLDAEIARVFRRTDWWRANLRQTMLFDHVFYPEDPDQWPATTVDAVRADSGETLLDDAKTS